MSIKVLHCIHSLSGGGAETQLITLANHAHLADMACGIFCINPEGGELDKDITMLYEIKNKNNYPWKLIKEIRSVIKEFNPDVVHCWLPVTLVVPGLIAAKLEGVPAVTSYRNARSFKGIKDIAEFLAGVFFADAIASNNTPAQSNVLFQWLYNRKLGELIPNAVNVPDKYTEIKRPRENNDAFTILFVGRLVDAKNWQLLLQAVATLKEGKNWRLFICGTGEDDKVRNMIDELGLTEVAHMLGFRKDVYSIMAESDLLVLPSWNEGMPNVVLEAMSIGLPCVVSKIPAHTALFKDHAFVKYIDPSNAETLRLVLEDFIGNKLDYQEMSEAGQIFSKEFSPSILVKRYFKFYRNVILEAN